MFRPDPSNLISPKPANDSKISWVGAFRIQRTHIESIKYFLHQPWQQSFWRYKSLKQWISLVPVCISGVEDRGSAFPTLLPGVQQSAKALKQRWNDMEDLWLSWYPGWGDLNFYRLNIYYESYLSTYIYINISLFILKNITVFDVTFICIVTLCHFFSYRSSPKKGRNRVRDESVDCVCNPTWTIFVSILGTCLFFQFHSQNVTKNNMTSFNTRNLNRKLKDTFQIPSLHFLHSSFRQRRTCSELRTLWKCQRKWVVYKKRCRRDFWWCLNVKTQ